MDSARGDQQYCAIYLGLFCGMREAEVLGLSWDDVDFDNQVIQVVRTLDNEDEDNAVSDGTKTRAGTRPVEIDEEITEVLLAQKRLVEKYKKNAKGLFQDIIWFVQQVWAHQ